MMGDFYHLEGNEREIVKIALKQYVEKMASTKLVDIPVDDVVAYHTEYKDAQALLKSLIFDSQKPAGKPYHTLLIMGDDGFWAADFGDFDYGLVIAELEDRDDKCCIITTNERQGSIDGEIKRLNDEICPF